MRDSSPATTAAQMIRASRRAFSPGFVGWGPWTPNIVSIACWGGRTAWDREGVPKVEKGKKKRKSHVREPHRIDRSLRDAPRLADCGQSLRRTENLPLTRATSNRANLDARHRAGDEQVLSVIDAGEYADKVENSNHIQLSFSRHWGCWPFGDTSLEARLPKNEQTLHLRFHQGHAV